MAVEMWNRWLPESEIKHGSASLGRHKEGQRQRATEAAQRLFRFSAPSSLRRRSSSPSSEKPVWIWRIELVRSLATHQYQGISRERKPGRKMKRSGVIVAGTTTAEAPPPLEWKFSQVFGERTAGEEVQEGMSFLIPYSDRFLVVVNELTISLGFFFFVPWELTFFFSLLCSSVCNQ